jgi:hypothetical protein
MKSNAGQPARRRCGRMLGCMILMLGVATTAAADELAGSWFAEMGEDRDEPDRIYLELRSGEPTWRHRSGLMLALGDLDGISRDQVEQGSGPLTFRLERQPGTLSFEGQFHEGTGSGHFTFTLNDSFDEAMRQRGFRGIRMHEYQTMALQDVTLSWLDELRDLGLDDLEVDDVLALSIHGADADFVRQMQELGFDSRDVDDWVAMRIHGVDADFVRDMRSQGMRSDDPDDYVGMRIHDVTPEFLDEMRDLGYDLSLEEGQSFRIHGVDAAYIEEMSEVLGPRPDADELLAMRIHGVTRPFIREMEDLHIRHLDTEQLIAFRIHGVNADFVRELRDMGYDDLTAEELVDLRIHGIDSRTLRRWNRHRGASQED